MSHAIIPTLLFLVVFHSTILSCDDNVVVSKYRSLKTNLDAW